MCKIILIAIITVFYLPSYLYCQFPDSTIQSIINKTNLDSVINTVEILSGEKYWITNDTSYRIISRFTDHPDNEVAKEFIKYKLECFGLNTYEQKYSNKGKNIYAVQRGSLYPDKFYVICAHYDDISPETIAPGADDNASGVATVIEAARILSKYITPYSIIYATWDEEELGAFGSRYFAEQAKLNELNILGVINVDMLAWDYDNDSSFEIHIDSLGNSQDLSETFLAVNSNYNIGLIPFIYTPGTDASDHSSFWLYDYKALLVIERLYGGDFNWYWHTVRDKLDKFNLPYFHKLAKLSIGALACFVFDINLTVVQIDNRISKYYLEQNYPNPFNPITKIKYNIPSAGTHNNASLQVTLKIYDVLGNEIFTLLNEQKPAGNYEIEFDGIGLPSGIYFYQLKAGRFVETKKMVLLK